MLKYLEDIYAHILTYGLYFFRAIIDAASADNVDAGLQCTDTGRYNILHTFMRLGFNYLNFPIYLISTVIHKSIFHGQMHHRSIQL